MKAVILNFNERHNPSGGMLFPVVHHGVSYTSTLRGSTLQTDRV